MASLRPVPEQQPAVGAAERVQVLPPQRGGVRHSALADALDADEDEGEEEVDGFTLMAYKDKLEVKGGLRLSEGKAARLFAAIEQLRATPGATAVAKAGGTGGGGAAPTAYVIHGPGSEIWTHADSLLQNTWMKHGLHEFMRLIEVKEIQNIQEIQKIQEINGGEVQEVS